VCLAHERGTPLEGGRTSITESGRTASLAGQQEQEYPKPRRRPTTARMNSTIFADSTLAKSTKIAVMP